MGLRQQGKKLGESQRADGKTLRRGRCHGTEAPQGPRGQTRPCPLLSLPSTCSPCPTDGDLQLVCGHRHHLGPPVPVLVLATKESNSPSGTTHERPTESGQGSHLSLLVSPGVAPGGTLWLGLLGGALGRGKTKNRAEVSGGTALPTGLWAPRTSGASTRDGRQSHLCFPPTAY